MAPDIRRHELRLEAAEADDTSGGEAAQPLDPPPCDFLRDHRIIKTSIGGVRPLQGRPWIDPLARRLLDVKPAGRRLHHIRVRSDAADHEIDEEAQPALPASLGQTSDERVGGIQAVDGCVHALMIAREKNASVGARREQRRREHVIESHFLAALQMMRP